MKNPFGPHPTPEEIKALRARTMLTQTAFGAMLFVRMRTVQDWESGRNDMPLGLWELARIKVEKMEKSVPGT